VKRVLALGALVVVAGASAVPTAAADELEDYLRSAATASYSGRQIVVTTWGGDTSFGSYRVMQEPGLTLVNGTEYEARAGGGRMSSTSGDVLHGLSLEHWAEWRLHDRYEMGAVRTVTPFGREATSVDIMEGDVVRARLVFDVATAAPLRAEWFDASGSVYRISVLVDFSEIGEGVEMPSGEDVPGMSYAVMGSAGATRLPASAGGYWRADAYAGAKNATHVFYTDGLFSFSVVELSERMKSGPFSHGAKFKVGGHTFRRLIEPGAVWVYWSTPDHSYVLVGDLPPDHLKDVLGEMPEPGEPNVFVRMWRNLFG